MNVDQFGLNGLTRIQMAVVIVFDIEQDWTILELRKRKHKILGTLIIIFEYHSIYDLVKNVNSVDYQTYPNFVTFIKQVVTVQ